jgi:site-specific recombinase XerD
VPAAFLTSDGRRVLIEVMTEPLLDAPNLARFVARCHADFDLRHEAGCRWLEAGRPIHHVQEMLDSPNLSQTSTYLHAAESGLQDSMRRFERIRCTPVAQEAPMDSPPVRNDATADDAKPLIN